MPDPPEQIGKYRILERVGRGGMGTVYKAHDPVLDRLVALKVISSEAEVTDELKARFYREAQACAKLNHPGIVVVHDLGEDAGRLFIVMELLDGEELKQVISARRPVPLATKLAWMSQVCDGLHYAHQKGVIHRDIKPGNIFVLRTGQVKVLDFGIARIAAGSDPGLTRTGLIMGTLRYMSPEQARGRVDHRSDMFSVGAVLYELLAGRPAFDSEDPIQILEKLRAHEPAPLTDLDPAIPRELSALVERMLRKDPAQRFADLGEVGARLDAIRRELGDETARLAQHVRAQVAELRTLEATLARLLGQPADDETLPVPVDGAPADQLRGLARELGERLTALRARVRHAEAQEPAVVRAAELFRAGDARGAVAALEGVLREVPGHARAEARLQEARALATREATPPAAPAPLSEPLARTAPARPASGRATGRRVVALAALALAGLIGAYWLYPAARPAPRPPVTAPVVMLGQEVQARRVQDLAGEARRAAEAAAAPRLALPLWERAAGLERDADQALREQAFDRAQALWRDAEQAYRAAETEAAQKASTAERERVTALRRDRQAAEQAGGAAAAARREAEQAQAARYAATTLAGAREKEAEGQAALERNEYAVAQRRLREAQQEYQRASQEAQRAAEAEAARAATAARPSGDEPARPRPAKVDADQARARLEALKQRARPDAPDYRAAVTEEQRGDREYERAAFAAAAGHFRAAQRLYARAGGGTVADARPGGPDPRGDIRAVLDLYRRAIQEKDRALFRRIRPGLALAEIQRSFEQTRSHTVDLAIEAIDVQGGEAEARGRRVDVVVQQDGQTFRNEQPVVFTLRRRPAGWVIEAVN